MEISTERISCSKKQTVSKSRTIYLNEDIVKKILVHVPTKPLMRFRSVSKFWNSTIRDPEFAKKHALGKGRFKGLLITDFVFWYSYFEYPHGLNRVFYADYNADNRNVCTRLSCYEHFTWDLSHFTGVTLIVKGLIGLYNVESFVLCNVSTREMVLLPMNLEVAEDYNYHLGYDPVGDVYKVLKVFPNDDSHASFSTQIFTVGRGGLDLAWRSVDPSPVTFDAQSLDIDGTLYWMLESEARDGNTLIAFHLSSESFETIPLPEYWLSSADLAQIDGSPAIVTFGSPWNPDNDMVIWMMKKDARGGFESWIMQKHRLPLKGLSWAGTLPTGQMLVAQTEVKGNSVFFFEYDHIKNEMKLMKLDGPSEPRKPGVVDYESIQMCYHEENIIPLAPLWSIQRQLEIVAKDTTE